MIRIKWIFLFLAISIVSNGQDTIRIAVINDRFFENNVADDLRNRLENEIQQLLQHRYEIAFNYYSLIQDDQILPSQIDLAYTQNEIVVCYGTVSSDLASKRTNFPKPTRFPVREPTSQTVGIPPIQSAIVQQRCPNANISRRWHSKRYQSQSQEVFFRGRG